MIIPAVIIAVLTVHLAILWHHKHTEFPGRGRSEQTIEGSRLWPTYAVKSVALFGLVAAVLTAMGGLIQINPIWIYGPFRSSSVTAAVTSASQPDWYVGWMDGALRIMPPWEIRLGGFTVPNPFFPGVLLPGLTFAGLYLWPFIDARLLTRDRKTHHLLERPRNAPVRTGLGVAVFVFYTLLFVAGGNDVLAGIFNVTPEAITNSFRVLIFVAPAVAYAVTWKVCRDLARSGSRPTRGTVGSTVAQTATGGFVALDDPGHGSAPVVTAGRDSP
jgi:ubiquinol-cytochrome c reductase cytochrome b subunit